MICVSKNEAVCCEVQTHFGSLRFSRFIKKVLGAFSWLMHPKTKLFAMEFKRILKVLCLLVLQKKLWVQFHNLWVQNEAVCPEIQMHFGSSLLASFTEKVVGMIPQFMHPKMKRFAAKFRCILEVLCLQVLKKKLWVQFHNFCVHKRSCLPWNSDAFWKFSACKFYKKFWAQFHDLCVQKWNCLLWNSDAFCKFSASKVYREISGQIFTICVQKRSCLLWSSDPFCQLSACKIDKKVVGAFSRFMCRANKHSLTSTFCKNALAQFILLHIHKSLLGCSGTLRSSWLSHFIRMLLIWIYLDCECTRKLWRATCCIS